MDCVSLALGREATAIDHFFASSPPPPFTAHFYLFMTRA